MAAQAGLCMAWSETPEDMFCRVVAQIEYFYLTYSFVSESTGLLPRKRWLRPDMTEKLLTGTLSLNTKQKKKKKRVLYLCSCVVRARNCKLFPAVN